MASQDHDDEPRQYASPVCYAHEFERPALSNDETITLLNALLEGERAGAQGLADMAKTCRDATLAQLLLDVARDEGRYCVMLRSHVKRLGGAPTDATGVFYEKLMQRDGLAAQLKLLDRGQSAVVRMIDEALPRIADAALHADFVEMRDTHVRNIARCAEVTV
jgi:nitronate monooxygenase